MVFKEYHSTEASRLPNFLHLVPFCYLSSNTRAQRTGEANHTPNGSYHVKSITNEIIFNFHHNFNYLM